MTSMKKKTLKPALLLPGILMAAVVLSTGTSVYAKGGNEVNVGEADSHLKVTSTKERQTAISDADVVDTAAKKRQPGGFADEELPRQAQPAQELAPPGAAVNNPSPPRHRSQNQQRDPDKDGQRQKPSDSKP